MQHCVWQFLFSVTLLLTLSVSRCSAEPVVKIRFYNSWLFQINVKEYVAIPRDRLLLTTGCEVANIPNGVNGTISLLNGENVLNKSSLMYTLSPRWFIRLPLPTGIFSNDQFSTLKCAVNVTDGKTRVYVSSSDEKILHSKEAVQCVPQNGQFIHNEIISILCFSSGNSQWVSKTNGSLRGPSHINGRSYYANDTRFVKNYFELIDLSDATLTCRRRSNASATPYCNISIQNLSKEETLTIDITTNTPEHLSDSMVFTCHTNLPTELIKWRAKASKGINVLDLFNLDGERKFPDFTISHSLNSSQLIFSEKVTDLVSVSCSTERAGFVAVDTLQISNDSMDQYSVIITILVILTITASLLFVVSLSALAYVINKQQKAHENAHVTLNESRTHESEYHHASDCRRADTDSDEDNMRDVVHDYQHYDSADGPRCLTADILEDDAVITDNDIYESRETKE